MEPLLNRLLEDYGLTYLLESQDIEELTVLEVLINLGYFDPSVYTFDEEEYDD